MRWVILLLVFLVGFAAGAWRAGTEGRSTIKAAAALPLLIALIIGGYALYLWVSTPTAENFNDLAAASTGIVGAGLALLAFGGGLFGAWFRRAG